MVRPARRKNLEVLDQPFFRKYGLDLPSALAWYRPRRGFDRSHLRLPARAERAQGWGLRSLLMGFLETSEPESALAERTEAQALRFYAGRGFREAGRLPSLAPPGGRR